MLWKWKLFWGNIYSIYDQSNNKIREILIYHKKIYLLNQNRKDKNYGDKKN